MTEKHKRYIKRGFNITSDVITICLNAMLSVVLIAVLTTAIFGCILVVYVKANMSDGAALTLEGFEKNLSSVIYYTDPETGLLVEGATIQSAEYRIWLDYDDIPKNVEHALVAIEDQRFYEHSGVDWYRTTAALVNMFISMRDNFGGSTLTQQLIKNLTGKDDVTVQRKLEEIFSALEFEQRYTKPEIIQWYLNYVFFGRRAYGIAAAADTYFAKEVSELSIAQIASLIAIPNNPSLYDPFVRPENNKERQETILKQMYIQGYITEAEYNRYVAEEIVFKRGEGKVQEQVVYTWFEEAVIYEARADLAEHYGISEQAAMRLLTRGGFSIYSTMDPNIQQAIDDVYLDLENLPQTTGTQKQLQSAMIIVDPYTAEIKGLTGGVGEKPREQNLLYNRATMARRPPGSSIKPIAVYAPAMDAGLITPETKFDDSEDAVLTGRTDGWLPKNDNGGWDGVINIRTAIVRSRNVISALVLDKLTPAASFRFMTEKLGIELDPADEDYAPLALGQLTYGATVREMASAYTMFLNSGVRQEAITYTKILSSDGEVIIDNKPEQTVAISEVTAYWMTSILHNAVTSGTGGDANLGAMPTAGKTGTSGASKDRWFAGYTPYYVGVTWAGYDLPENISLAQRGNPAGQIWKRVMSAVHENLEVKSFPTIENTYQPPVPGINEVKVTVIHQAESGANILTEEKAAAEGASFTAEAMTFREFFVVGESSQTITANPNETRNVITFTYRYVPLPTPTPSPTMTPVPTPNLDDLWTPPPMPSYEPYPTPEEDGDDYDDDVSPI